MNKVLNRPMFRREALRKGVLKPIHAQVGRMIGLPTGGSTAYNPNRVPAVIPGQGPYTPGKPGIGARMRGFGRNVVQDVRNFPGGAVRDPRGTIMGTRPFGMGGGISRLLGFEGIYSTVDPYVGQYIQNPYGKMAVSTGLSLLGTMNPYVRGAGMAKSIYDMGAAGARKIGEGIQEYRATPVSERRVLPDISGEAAIPEGTFATPEQVKEQVSLASKARPGEGRPGFDRGKLKEEGDELLDDKYSSIEGDANLNSIQADALGNIAPVPPEGQPPQLGGASTVAQAEARVKGETPKLTTAEKKSLEAEDKKITENIINRGGVSGDPSFDQTIKLAKRYYDEVYSNRGSQANLIFLANLASGLLTGTTAKAGIGGAMEVLGQAIGPAVNNYVTVKLKEGELRQNAREASLNAALDHMKFVNDNAKVERPDQTGGIVQIRGADGRLRNYKAYQMADGTVTMASGVGPDGRETFTTIPQGEAIVDSEGNTIGNFENFQKQDSIDKRLFDIQDTLGNRYNAYSVTRDVLQTLGQMDEDGEQVKAGAGLSIDQFTRRMSGVAKEILGFDVTGMSKDELDARVKALQQDEYDAIDRDPDLTDSEKKTQKEKLNNESLIDAAKKRILKNSGSKGWFSGLSGADQEKLAVQEVTLVYALANTFKDQDRLTQRDIDAAQKIVNIFSLTRSSKDVRDSIEAISKQLESDIRRQEGLYTQAGGLETTLRDLRKLKQAQVFESTGGVTEQLMDDLGIEEIEQGLAGVEL
jgi:hypothetical protein